MWKFYDVGSRHARKRGWSRWSLVIPCSAPRPIEFPCRKSINVPDKFRVQHGPFVLSSPSDRGVTGAGSQPSRACSISQQGFVQGAPRLELRCWSKPPSTFSLVARWVKLLGHNVGVRAVAAVPVAVPPTSLFCLFSTAGRRNVAPFS